MHTEKLCGNVLEFLSNDIGDNAMKVGIMSMQRVVNYGSFLQAYGLRSVIEELNHSVEFVDYLPEPPLVPEVQASYGSRWLVRVKNLLRMASPAYRKYRNDQIRMNNSFAEFYRSFQEKFLPVLEIGQQRNYCPELDALVIGSDEVFNCTQPGSLVGYSLQLFGKDHRAKKLVSYAASFGSTTLEKLEQYQVTDEIGEYLKEFDAISVRDDNSAEIVSKLTGCAAGQHIDPVLLYDFPEVEELPISLRDYIVVYAYAGRIQPAEAEEICRFARKHQKKILCLGFYQPFCDEYVLASPLEVLAYMKHADYVVTDTFHGTVFSIKYQVPFATIIRESNQQKLSDLLHRFRLDDRRVMALPELEKTLCAPMDPASVKVLLNQYQTDARNYLRSVLEES